MVMKPLHRLQAMAECAGYWRRLSEAEAAAASAADTAAALVVAQRQLAASLTEAAVTKDDAHQAHCALAEVRGQTLSRCISTDCLCVTTCKL